MIVRKLRAAKNTDEFDPGKVDALCEQAADEIERLRAEIDRLQESKVFDELQDCQSRAIEVHHNKAVMRAAMGEIETIANTPPADDRYGSLAVRMGQVWLLARGHQQQVTEK